MTKPSPKLWKWIVCLLRLFPILTAAEMAWSAEPMMDESVFTDTRIVAQNLAKDGQFAQALAAEEKAYQITQNRYGPLHLLLVPILNDMAVLNLYLAEYQKSEEELKWGLALVEKNLGPNAPEAADSLERLASLYIDLNRLSEAELLAQRALAIRKTDHHGGPKALGQTLRLLGLIETSLEKNDQAQTLLTRALGSQEKNASADPLLAVNLWNDLAQTYLAQRNFAEAQSSLEKSLSLAQKAFPTDSVVVADAMGRLADFYHGQQQEDKAIPLYTAAAQIDKHFVGTYFAYPSLPYLRRLAQADFAIGNFKTAEFLWKKTVETDKKVFGLNHPKVAVDLISLSEAESALKKQPQARESLKESLSILKSVFSDDHPLVLLVQKRLK
jgi:tetratricopeptide (TPR) repeat protein